MSERETDLEKDVFDFALQEMETLAGILCTGDLGLAVDEVTRAGVTYFNIYPNDRKGIVLTVDGQEFLRLEVTYQCCKNSERSYMAVDRSRFSIRTPLSSNPLFRYDFERSPGSMIPGAHINIHGYRDDLTATLLYSGLKKRGKQRRKAFLAEGTLPRMSDLHFPVGGPRFRPCLEDVLEMAISEFGIDKREGYKEVLNSGRARFRDIQLRSAVKDNPEAAKVALQQLGYDVIAPKILPKINREKVTAL